MKIGVPLVSLALRIMAPPAIAGETKLLDFAEYPGAGGRRRFPGSVVRTVPALVPVARCDAGTLRERRPGDRRGVSRDGEMTGRLILASALIAVMSACTSLGVEQWERDILAKE